MPRLPLPEQVAIVRDCGYAAIELVSSPGAPLDALATDAATRKQVRRSVQEAGLELVSIAGHADMLDPDATKAAAALERVTAGVDLAADLGAPCLVAMGFGKPDRYVEQRSRLVDLFGELARHGQRRGVVVALE